MTYRPPYTRLLGAYNTCVSSAGYRIVGHPFTAEEAYSIVIRNIDIVGKDDIENAFNCTLSGKFPWAGTDTRTVQFFAGAWTLATILEPGNSRPYWHWEGRQVVPWNGYMGFNPTAGTLDICVSGYVLAWPTPETVGRPGSVTSNTYPLWDGS